MVNSLSQYDINLRHLLPSLFSMHPQTKQLKGLHIGQEHPIHPIEAVGEEEGEEMDKTVLRP
jgi:hypothetical protein